MHNITFPQLSPETIELIVTTTTTLFAAYLGAKFAFCMQNRKQKKDDDQKNITNANLALFTLIRYHNKFLNIKSQVIGGFEQHPNRHHFIKPELSTSIDSPRFDYSGLAFLIDSNPNLLGHLSILEHDIYGTFELIEKRSKFHFEQLQPTVERLSRQLPEDSEITPEQVDQLLGDRDSAYLRTTTDFMVSGINRAIESTLNLSVQLGAATKKLYPKAKIIKIVQ